MKLPVFCCRSLRWDSLLTVCARRNSHDSWHVALGTVRGQLPRAEMRVSTWPQCSFFFLGCKFQPFFMVSWLLNFTKHGHLIKTRNLQLVHLLLCSTEWIHLSQKFHCKLRYSHRVHSFSNFLTYLCLVCFFKPLKEGYLGLQNARLAKSFLFICNRAQQFAFSFSKQ